MLGQGAWEGDTKGMYVGKEEGGEEKNEEEKDRKEDGERKRLRSEGSGLCACVSMQAQNLQERNRLVGQGKSQHCHLSHKVIK